MKRVLIVEDNKDVRAMMVILVRGYEYEAIEAENGYEAIEKTKLHRPDLILMDFAMPLMDGIEATKIIRTFNEFSETPIVALTAFGNSLTNEAIQIGVNEIIQKPLDFGNIESILRRYLH
jgi:CheY-like chemotaxis protein